MNWLLLIHQIPAKPGYLRAKILRRLQRAGAVALKQSVYILPDREPCREDLLWIEKEIVSGGGEAIMVRAELLTGLDDQQVADLLRAARRSDYEKIQAEIKTLLASRRHEEEAMAAAEEDFEHQRDLLKQIAKLRKSLEETAAIDFFSLPERIATEALLHNLETDLRKSAARASERPVVSDDPAAVAGKTWVTRRDLYVDRMASAWLIRRYIDPAARFHFTAADRAEAAPDQVRFDMAEAEYTHEGNQCTFEVLVRRFGLDEPALSKIAEVIHDIDLKETAFGRQETAGIKALFDGIVAGETDDLARIDRAGTVLDGLLAYYQTHSRP